MPARVQTLTLRELNRALLARQFLLRREKAGVVDAVERLAGLQAQWAPSPYVALWSRLASFEREQLTRPIDRGEIVKATLMRATLHLVSGREYPAYSLATMEGASGHGDHRAAPRSPISTSFTPASCVSPPRQRERARRSRLISPITYRRRRPRTSASATGSSGRQSPQVA